MMRMIRPAAILVLVTLAGVAAAENLGDYQTKGFLSTYENLRPVGGDSDAFLYESEKVDKSKYNKLMVDRIKIFLKEDAEYKGIDATELKELADYFHSAIVEAVSDAYPVVEEPGADVVRLRIAVTDLVPNKVEASVVTLVVPYVWIGEASAGAAEGEAGTTPFVGEASIEMEALDSLSHDQVAAYISTRAAKKYNWTHGVKQGVSDYVKAYSTWDYTKQAMDGWAGLIRERLDAAHGITGDK